MRNVATCEPRNSLLAQLPEDTCARLHRDLKLVPLVRGMELSRQDANSNLVYFPRSGVVSMLHILANGDSGEVALVGNEGVVGLSLLVDSQSMPLRAVVQSAGEAWAMPAAAAVAELSQGADFTQLVLRYIEALMAQMAQATICTRRHKVEQQAARWLLFAFERAGDDELKVTHETISEALGVRREGITEALGRLQHQHGIRCSRGCIRLVDRPALEASSCECYGVVRNKYQRLLGSSPSINSSPKRYARSLTGMSLGSDESLGSGLTQDLCVLIAEDEMCIALQLEDQLIEAGYRVLKAARLLAAIDLAQSAQIDAAILDINLGGTEIFPAAAILRKRGIPFLFSSSYKRNRLPPDFCGSHMLQKPYEQALLQRELAKLLD